jgi:hypothetical protein
MHEVYSSQLGVSFPLEPGVGAITAGPLMTGADGAVDIRVSFVRTVSMERFMQEWHRFTIRMR